MLTRRNLAQAIRESADGIVYPEHSGKKGTPSMGGLAIVVAVVLGYGAGPPRALEPPTASGLLALYLMVGLALVGFADDYLKVFKSRSGGVRARTKLLGQAAVASELRRAERAVPGRAGADAGLAGDLGRARHAAGCCPWGCFVLWIWFMVTAITNGVNLTDGLDGLAAGASVLTFGGFTLIGVWQYGQSCLVGAGRRLLRRARPARHDHVRGRLRGRLLRLPVVEHQPGADLHGRHRLASRSAARWRRWP